MPEELQVYTIVAAGLAGRRANDGEILGNLPPAAQAAFSAEVYARMRKDSHAESRQRFYDYASKLLHNELLGEYIALYDEGTPFLGASLTADGYEAFCDIIDEYIEDSKSGQSVYPRLADMVGSPDEAAVLKKTLIGELDSSDNL